MLRRSYVNKKNIFIVFALVLVVLLVFRPSVGSVSFTSYPSDPEGQTVQIHGTCVKISHESAETKKNNTQGIDDQQEVFRARNPSS